MIELINVKKIYTEGANPAVNEVNLQFGEGEITILVGPSGCGKTTMLKMLNRIEEPTDGQIMLNGQSILELDPLELRRDIGYVIQHIGLFPHMTIADNVATVPRLKKWPKEKINKRVSEMLNLVSIPENFRRRLPGELSGGQQQRVGVARALAGDPPVMLMDEPFGALDPITREHLQNEFLKIQQKIQKTIVFVTHDIEEAFKMGERIVVMNQGRVVQFDTPLNILSKPASEFVSDLTGSDRGLRYLSLIPVGSLLESEEIEQEKPERHKEMDEGFYDGVSLNVDDSLKNALNLMVEYGASSIPVVDDTGTTIGHLSVYSLVQGMKKLWTS
ncbi:MAG: ABC transporter ATP-binding protein [Bacillota bacterium]|nr:ABC transporter ATP-binding protein [Bacillota bacterium]